MGMSEGQGIGDRPEEETDVGFFDTKASPKVGRGAASIVGEVEGPNLAGDVQQEVQEFLESAESRSVDPLTDQKMPRGHRGHAREYFDRLREGQ